MIKSPITGTMAITSILLLSLLAADFAFAAQVRMTGYSLQEYPGALCLDGTPAMYYYSPGNGDGTNKWYIEMQGGGWCGGFEHCLSRAETVLGSTSNWPEVWRRNTPFFSDDSTTNPLMHDWNKIYFVYCDGFSFSGNASDPVERDGAALYLRGNDILEAGIDDMLFKRNLWNTMDVVIGGCSARGLMTFLRCDHWAERIQQHLPQVKVGCAPKSGFFMNYNGTSSHLMYHDLMLDGLAFH